MSNADLEKLIETSDEWIVSRTGISERRILAETQATSDTSTFAAKQAIESAGIKPEDIDLLICCTCTPDHIVPNTACIVQHKLGIAGRCPAFDLNAACTGFVYGLSVATSMLRTGNYKHALVIGADSLSRILDYTDRNTCILFGDGAGAVVLGPSNPERGLIGEFLTADGSMQDFILVRDSGTRISTPEEKATMPRLQMKGSDVFKFATRALGHVLEAAVKSAGGGLKISDLDLIFPHQANLRIIEAAAKRLDIPMEKVYVNIQRYGNTSAAAIPMALAEASRAGRIHPGNLVGLVAFGGGLTAGASIWKW